MIDVSQLITRIQILLSGTNLEDTPHGRNLFEEYNNLCKSANARLVECNALFEAQRNVEAIVVLSSPPELLNLVEKLQFSELDDFLNLAQMYDWGIAEKINLSIYEKLKASHSSMLNSYALISEYSQISRSDKVEEKLVLLRKIVENEPNNTEWIAVIQEVESEYLRKIINEAQSAIINHDYNRLGEIQDELANSSWHIEIPGAVTNKINTVMHTHRLSQMPEQIQNLLTEGENAYKLQDIIALEDTLFLIDTLCSENEYIPANDILTRIKQLKESLADYKENQKNQKEWQSILNNINNAIDSNESIEKIQELVRTTQNYPYEIPKISIDRINSYIKLKKSQRIHKKIIFIFNIFLFFVFVGIVLSGITWWFLTSKQIKDFVSSAQLKMNEYKIKEVQEDMLLFEKNHLFISYFKEIKDLHDSVDSMKEEMNKKHKVFIDLLNEFELAFSKIKLDASLEEAEHEIDKLEEKLQLLSEKAYSVEEKNEFNKLKETYNLKKDEIKLKKDEIAFKQEIKFSATKYKIPLDVIEKCVTLYNQGKKDDARELLKASCQENENKANLNKFYTSIGHADNLDTLQHIIKNAYESNQALYKTAEMQSMLHLLEEDSKVLNDLIAFQKTKKIDILSRYRNMSYFIDIIKSEEAQSLNTFPDTIVTDLSKLINIFANISCLTFLTNDNQKIEIYHRGNINGSSNTYFSTTMLDDSKITISYNRNDGFVIRQFDNDNIMKKAWPGVTITDPEPPLTLYKLKATQPPFMKTCKNIKDKVLTLSLDNISTETINLLSEIQKDDNCLPYIKILMMQKLLSPFSSLNSSSFNSLKKLNNAILKIIESDEAASGDISNKNLNSTSKVFLEHLDMKEYYKKAEIYEIEQKLIKIVSQWKFQYLGILYKENNHEPQIFISNKISKIEADVLCFDDKKLNFVYLGRLHNNNVEYVISDITPYIGRILFTIKGNDYLSQITNENIKLINKHNITEISWPLSWPINLLLNN